MRILIQFPYNTHYKTRNKFMKDYDCVFLDSQYKKECLFFSDNLEHFFNMYDSLDSYNFPLVDIWKIRKPYEDDNFALQYYLDLYIEPKEVNYHTGSLENV